MSDNYTIKDLGGAELARYYPDHGLLPESNSYSATLQTDPEVEGIWSWIASMKHCNGFWAVLSADAEGLRVLVNSDEFAIYLPWNEAMISAERASPATTVRIKTTAVPSLDLVFNLDDEAADDLFRNVIPALERRDPPRHLFWWKDKPLLFVLMLVVSVSAAVALFYLPRMF
jgi:hypothetical protein